MTDIRLLYVTTKDAEQARHIGRQLVERKLVACANVLPAMESIYHWKGQLQTDSESVLILKTTAAHVSQVIEEVEKLHSYDSPCVLVLNVEAGAVKYLAWLTNETRP